MKWSLDARRDADDGFERSHQNERTRSKDCFFLPSTLSARGRESEQQEFISSSLRVVMALPANELFKDEENNVYPVYVSCWTTAEHVEPLMLCPTECQREGTAASDAEAEDHPPRVHFQETRGLDPQRDGPVRQEGLMEFLL